MERKIDTSTIKEFLNKSKKEHKTYTYSDKTIERRKLRKEERLKWEKFREQKTR